MEHLCISLSVERVRGRALSRMPPRPDPGSSLSCGSLFVKFRDVVIYI